MGRASNIKSISVLPDEVDMVDFSVAGAHCYYANGLLVHNCSEEVALVANMSREEGFLYPLRHDLDVHMYVAETRFHVSDPEFRDKSKAVSFGKIYGGGPTMMCVWPRSWK